MQNLRKIIRDKRGINAIIVILLIITLSFAAIFLIYYNLNQVVKEDFGEQVACFEELAVVPSFFIKDACYYSDGEIAVRIERKTDAITLRNIKLVFYGENTTRWLIKDNKKCSDVRRVNTEYGGYCELVHQDTEMTYVFNTSDLDKKQNVKLVITQLMNGEEKSCLVDSRKILESC